VVDEATGSDLREAAGAGAAGGVGFAALAALGAELRPGIELILELVDFATDLQGADLVITGEGGLDDQTLHGKAPAGVSDAARTAGVDVVAVCGRNLLDADTLERAGISTAYALTDLEPDLDRCMTAAAELLKRIGANIAREYLAD
jgi:glycerate kinase